MPALPDAYYMVEDTMNASEYIKDNMERFGRNGVYIWTPIGTKVSKKVGTDIRPAGTITGKRQNKKGDWFLEIDDMTYHKEKADGGRFPDFYEGDFTFNDPNF